MGAGEEAELAAMQPQTSANESLMQAIRTLGRLPSETRAATKYQKQLAVKLRKARQAGQLGAEEEAELEQAPRLFRFSRREKNQPGLLRLSSQLPYTPK